MYNKINYLKLRDDYNRMDKNDRYKSFYLMTLFMDSITRLGLTIKDCLMYLWGKEILMVLS